MIHHPLEPRASVGHVHHKVADLARALGFYCGVLGYAVTQRYGKQAMLTRPLDPAGLLRETMPDIPSEDL